MEALMIELQRLKYHRGFPYGKLLKCPVVLEDKYEYLSILHQQNMCNPTLKVERSSITGIQKDDELAINKILEFLNNCKEEGCGWVVKLPFVTNQVIKGIKSREDLIKRIYSIFTTDTKGIYPYVMIQPCMKNRKEYKVVYIPRKDILYVANIKGAKHSNGRKAFSSGDHLELFAFVKKPTTFNCNCFVQNCKNLLLLFAGFALGGLVLTPQRCWMVSRNNLLYYYWQAGLLVLLTSECRRRESFLLRQKPPIKWLYINL
mmetsp:Transcript_5290/g.7495  ORF Transcript_5290/g.7495 Transcript_5290/m.7495 type:complete len:260 (-) Transcript_5290:157-936(-)